ncbi:hypothetical protein E2C01_051211 [Portunus trituberculatus]|uniref:Uncharacterized protein n=1 Tax=Portunus trituberculatus TaxID=210409 RepID=A0A5B7GL50_PORTR|nr:hypothetical protein [Portunus trituberculatus]
MQGATEREGDATRDLHRHPSTLSGTRHTHPRKAGHHANTVANAVQTINRPQPPLHPSKSIQAPSYSCTPFSAISFHHKGGSRGKPIGKHAACLATTRHTHRVGA